MGANFTTKTIRLHNANVACAQVAVEVTLAFHALRSLLKDWSTASISVTLPTFHTFKSPMLD